MNASRLKHNGNATDAHDSVHLPTVERNRISRLTLNDCSSDERNISTEGLSCPAQNIFLFSIAQEIHITSVHINGIHETGTMGCDQVLLKRFNGDRSVFFKWQ